MTRQMPEEHTTMHIPKRVWGGSPAISILRAQWQLGSSKRTIYAIEQQGDSRYERLIGVMDHPELAEHLTALHNDTLEREKHAERTATPPIMLHPYQAGQTVAVSGIPGVPNGSKLWIKRVEPDGTLVFEL